MRARDKAILTDLERFRCMRRDDIADLYFNHVKNPITQTNLVMKRLRRDGYLDADMDQKPYMYFPIPSIKKDSQKIPHFLSIVDFYKTISRIEKPVKFEIEPKYGKEYMEPDIFTIWKSTPFFVEVQRKQYNSNEMRTKMERYEKYYYSDEWKGLPWQPSEKKIFPRVWMLTKAKYNLDTPFKLIQTKDVEEFLQMIKK